MERDINYSIVGGRQAKRTRYKYRTYWYHYIESKEKDCCHDGVVGSLVPKSGNTGISRDSGKQGATEITWGP